jgi:hypothetical protein
MDAAGADHTGDGRASGLCASPAKRAASGVIRSCSNFIAYASPFVNGEITHDLRDKGFLISR